MCYAKRRNIDHFFYLALFFVLEQINCASGVFVHAGLFGCLHNPPNSDMDYSIQFSSVQFKTPYCPLHLQSQQLNGHFSSLTPVLPQDVYCAKVIGLQAYTYTQGDLGL